MADQELVAARPPASVHVARVCAVKHYTDALFAFSVQRPAALRFRSGEFVMIGLMDGAKPLLRAYSIASPSWDDELAFYSIKVPGGPLTSRLQHIHPGDDILIGRKTTGTLVLDALTPGQRLFLLATGTGIAPFASLIRDPEVYERFEEIILIQTCRTASELVYGEEIVASAIVDSMVGDAAASRLRHVTSLTRGSHALEGRITTLIETGALFTHLGSRVWDPTHDRVMICGSSEVLRALKALAESAGFVEGANSEPGSFVIERAFVG